MGIKRFVCITDTHYGFERVNGHKRPLHDLKAIHATMAFISDFKPDFLIHLGDGLDCGAISHWNKNRRHSTEGLRLLEDVRGCKADIMQPLNRVLPDHCQKVYMTGNHEDWLQDLLEEYPGLEGLIDIDTLLGLTAEKWKLVPVGEIHRLGKLHFVHGDMVSGSENIAKNAVLQYERSIRLGHHHTFQVSPKISAVDIRDARTGIVIPCLCRKNPGYGQNKPNRWVQGFSYGYLHENGNFNDYVVVIVDGKCVVNGKLYKG